jgi:hypothetical protein
MTLTGEIGLDSPCSPLLSIDRYHPMVQQHKNPKCQSFHDENPFQLNAPQFFVLHDPPKNPTPNPKFSSMGTITL